jgi:DNA-binding NarL/FixJ family response regulator
MSTFNQIKKKRVFIVDDHSILREGLAHLINGEDDLAVCGESESVSDALQKITDCSPDIAVVDITLEDGSGIRLVEDLKYSIPGLPVLVLSMHDEFIYAERCLKSGAKGYIMKQEPSEKFLSAIRSLLNGKIYVSENLGSLVINKLYSSRTETPASLFDTLSNRELELYQLFGQGLKKRDIAEKLNLSIKTIENYVENIKKKMDLKDMHEIVIHAVQNTAAI